MADPKVQPRTLDEVELPETKPYRVAMLGATYNKAEAVYGPTGPTLQFLNVLGSRGEIIYLDDAQAHRLLALGAVKEADDPRAYTEMNETELAALAKSRGVEVRSSSLDENQPLRPDYIAALEAHDAGVASIVPVQPPAPPEGPGGLRPEHEGMQGVPGSPPAASTSADPALTGTGDVPSDVDSLKGQALTDAAAAAGIDVTTGGSKRDGGMTADEVRAALRERATTGGTSEADVIVSGAPAATEANVNALSTYLQRVSPTPEQTVAIARTNTDDPAEGARAVLDAENMITGHDPRGSVLEQLQAIIDGKG
jgi:hypothetical protein